MLKDATKICSKELQIISLGLARHVVFVAGWSFNWGMYIFPSKQNVVHCTKSGGKKRWKQNHPQDFNKKKFFLLENDGATVGWRKGTNSSNFSFDFMKGRVL